MTCITDYNLIKEGDIYNVKDSATYLVTTSGFENLYKTDESTTAYTIPADTVSSIEITFGEYFDVCNAKYYASSLVLNDISVGYGKESADENSAVISLSGTFVFIDIGEPIGYLRITHSGTSSVSVQKLNVEGVLNDSIGFGTASSGELTDYFLSNTPIKHYSSNYMSVPIFNEYTYDADVKVAVEPTGELIDKYIYISADSEGPYYGINDYGMRSPSFIPITTTDDSFSYESISNVYDKWDIRMNCESYLSLGSDYVQLNIVNNNPYIYRQAYGYNDMRTLSFVSKEYFTSDQSFTISLKVRYVDADFDIGAVKVENKLLFGFTDTFPIFENCLPLKDLRDYPYYNRGTNSLAAVWFGAVEDTVLKVGAAANNADYNNFTNFNNFKELTGTNFASPLLDSITMEYLSSYVYGESDYYDGTSSSPWRELKLSYDYTTRTCYYFIDDIQLDSFTFYSSAFYENCKLFLCFVGAGPAVIQIKDFSIEKDKVLLISTNQTSASAVDSADADNQGPEKLVDKIHGFSSTLGYLGEGAWVSGANPQVNDYFTIGFGQEVDLYAVRIKQAQESDAVTVSGVSYTTNFALNRAVIEFDTGDIRIVNFEDPKPSGMDGWDVSYLLTTSGTIEPVLGTTSAVVKYTTFHDREVTSAISSFSVDEIEFYWLEYKSVLPTRVEEAHSYTWSRGHFTNLKSAGSDTVYVIDESDKYEVAAQQDKWNMFRYADYDAKNIVGDITDSVGGYYYHYAESIFAHTKWSGNERRQIHSKSGESSWVWRYFPNKVNVAAFYSLFQYFISAGGYFHSMVDKWKVQYLIDGGNPNVVSDWKDIPPIVSAHGSGGYALYSQYLVDHNDGEYYTDCANMYSTVGSFVTTSELYCNKNVYNKIINIDSRNALYVEFDDTYYTQGIKLVIASGFSTDDYPSVAEGYSFLSFMAYSKDVSALYVSPVFDMETKQNTERININVNNFDGASRILFRSSSIAPQYKFDSSHEAWQDYGSPYSGLDAAPSYGWFYDSKPILSSDGQYIYVFPEHPAPQIDSVLRIDLDSNKWEEYIQLDSDLDGEVVAADPRTRNSVVYVGGAFLVASRSGDGTYTNGLSLLHIEPTQYGYTGWENFSYQRQTSAVYATMVYDGNDRVFFLGTDLEVTVFYKSTGELTTENRATVPGHGSYTRDGICAAYANGKIYVAGGNNTGYLDIYDVNADIWISGAYAPNIINLSQMLHVDGILYILPTTDSDKFSAYLKYNIEDDSWCNISSMNYNIGTHILDSQYGDPDTISPVPDSYCLHGNYIYAMSGIRSDFRRTKVIPDSWQSGYLPSNDILDSAWFNNGGMNWHEATVSGEFMPQDRYIQYKIELLNTVSGSSPIVSSANLVQPITISGVPSGGNKNLYLKTYISDEVNFDIWYTGRRHAYDEVRLDAILYARSNDGIDFYGGEVVEEAYRFDLGVGPLCFRDPHIIHDSVGYTVWATEGDILETNGSSFISGDIYRAVSSDRYNWGAFSVCVSKNTEGTYDVNSIYSPRVLKDSQYEMWYTGEDTNDVPRILYASSSDGITWSNHQLSHDIYTAGLEGDPDKVGVRKPFVLKKDSVYWMYYEGISENSVSSILLCKSTDGLTWINHEVVISATDISDVLHNCNSCGSPCVVDDVDEMHMWFVARTVCGDAIIYSKSSGGSVWSDFKVAIHRGENGYYDRNGVDSPFVMLDRAVPESNTFLNARVKIYND